MVKVYVHFTLRLAVADYSIVNDSEFLPFHFSKAFNYSNCIPLQPDNNNILIQWLRA